MENPLLKVHQLGQSIWYDNIRRGLITSGELHALVKRDGVCGVTSNPAIFEKALSNTADYDQAMRALVEQGVGTNKDIYERLAIQDIQMAADLLAPIYHDTNRRDGYVSFEVSPHLAHDTRGTIKEARRLRSAVDRENVMIKVPATQASIPAITQLVSEGTNINVTLLFAVDVYEAAATAYMAGLERLCASGGELAKVSSVASFFVSRLDSLIDERLNTVLDAADPAQRDHIKGLLGTAAIANAKAAYAAYQNIIASQRWQSLAARGAKPQRLLWASTSTKNPAYPKTRYIDALIGPDTVNTLPDETLSAFRQLGRPQQPRLAENWPEELEQARARLRSLDQLGISLQEATDHLLTDGVKKFGDPFDALLSAIEHKRQALLGPDLARQDSNLGEASPAVEAALKEWRASGKVRRLWQGDTSLWSRTDEDRWLGWLSVVERQREHLAELRQIVDELRASGIRHLVLLGMGGSSLCPDVLRVSFAKKANDKSHHSGRGQRSLSQGGFPELHVLDSTVPAQVQATVKRIDPARTVCIVSSKSGGTIEPQVLKDYFADAIQSAIGPEPVGSRFIAITDPETALHRLARAEGFRHIVHGSPDIGGRFSALSPFGLLPAALMGVDVERFLDSAMRMVQSCAASVPPDANPGVSLGIILATLGQQGRDKLTFITSPPIGSLETWLEQLIAESTGKNGRGLIPVAGEPLGPPEVYGHDRLFVYIRLNTAPSTEQDAAVAALERAGQPSVRITLEQTIDLGQEFFRWEIATAVAGSLLGVNPFNQPDVEASKRATRTLMDRYQQEGGARPGASAMLEEAGLRLSADARNADALLSAAPAWTLEAALAAHLSQLRAGDYLAINAYLDMSPANGRILQQLRQAIRDKKRVATTLGYGPRFLHSTGQLHKGGPDTGVFLQLTADDSPDIAIPGRPYSFGVLKNAQAQGDAEVLAERGRRCVRIHLGADIHAGLAHLHTVVQRALGEK